MIEQKKGIALNRAFGAVLVLVLVATLVIIGIVIFSTLSTSFAGTSSASIVNESITPVTTGVLLGGTSNCSAGDFSVTAVNNVTNSINSGNWTVTNEGLFSNTTSTFSGNWQVSYDYTWGSSACTASQGLITQFASYPVLVGLVGTIIFLGIVIGVLVASFAFGGRDRP